jgi:hypothetical protein
VVGLVALSALLLAQQVLLWWLYYHGAGKQLVGDELQYLDAAHAILAGGPWHASDIWPPAQALFIAAIAWFGGPVVLDVQFVQTLLFFGCGLLLWHLWARLSDNAWCGALAAALFLLNPGNAAYAQYLWPEIPHLFVLLLALDLLLARTPARLAAFCAGALIGLALLFKSLLTGFWPLFLLCFVGWRPLRIRWACAACFLVGLGIVTAPALVAGHRNTGHWRIADSSAINLLIGLGDVARNDYIPGPSATFFGAYIGSGHNADERDAWAWREIDERLREQPALDLLATQLGRQYFRLFESKTLLLTQLPGPACAGYISSYPPTPPAVVSLVRWSSHFAHAAMLLGFALGLCLHLRWRKPWTWILLGLLGYQLALYLGLHVKARYLLPMVPILCGFAADALVRLAAGAAAVPRTRIALGAVLGGLLLVLAFAGPWIDGYCRG